MKREFLAELFKKHELEIPKEVIDSIMDENGKDLESGKKDLDKAKSDLKSAQTKASDLEGQVKQRDADIADLQKQATTSQETQDALKDLQTKYDSDTQALNQKLKTQQEESEKELAKQARDHAIDGFFEELPFASELARKAARSAFTDADLKYDPETKKFLGADDWLEQLKESDPAAFKADEHDDDGNPPPFFVTPTNQNGGNSNPAPSGDGFSFANRFSRLRQPGTPGQQETPKK